MRNCPFKNKCSLSCAALGARAGPGEASGLEIAALCRAADEVPIIALSFLPFFPSSPR